MSETDEMLKAEEALQEIEVYDLKKAKNSLCTVDIRDASAEGMILMRQRVEAQHEMIRLAISLTSPRQWTVFKGNGVESVYPTGAAADTILRRAFGLTWGMKEVTVKGEGRDMMATAKATLMNGTTPVEEFEGVRRMGGYVNNEADLRKGAIENMKSVAVRDLLGLRFKTPEDLEDLGLSIRRHTPKAEFSHGKKQSSEVVAPFGKQKGCSLPDLTDENLSWLISVIEPRVSDPEHSKWKERNQGLLDAMLTEKGRRLGYKTER